MSNYERDERGLPLQFYPDEEEQREAERQEVEERERLNIEEREKEREALEVDDQGEPVELIGTIRDDQ